jgi:cyclophilin family peptidyl-prolyl cis-trans isomerase
MRRGILMATVALALALIAGCGEDEELTSTADAFSGANQTEASTADGTATSGAGAPDATDTTGTTEGGTQPMQWSQPPAMALEAGKDYGAVIKTSKGDIVVDLFEAETPVTVNNFVFLAQEGYYTNVPFHRIIKDFMVQTGDPTGTGAGSPGYRFQDEPVTREYTRGTLAMANAGPNTNGSQFFIVHADSPLPKNYTIFGTVVEGLDTLDAIASVPVRASARGEMSVPTEPVTLESVEVTVK